MHTPALYSHFLRALVAAKRDARNGEPNLDNMNGNGSADAEPNMAYRHQNQNLAQHQNQVAHNQGEMDYGYTGEAGFTLGEFQFEGEMGPVADMSTFPPTMAPNPSGDNMGALTMDNILSSGFWDSVLVPGMVPSRMLPIYPC